MTLTFHLEKDGPEYSLTVQSGSHVTHIDASEAELRRLMVDLEHEFMGADE